MINLVRYKQKCTNELLNTTHAHQSSGRFPIQNCGIQIILCWPRTRACSLLPYLLLNP